jgi:hypothetical protein
MDTPDPQSPRPLTDIERQRGLQELRRIEAELSTLMERQRGGYRSSLAILMATGAFTREDLQMMFRGQAIAPEFGGHPCQQYGAGDISNLEVPELRRTFQRRFLGALDPVARPRNRLHCPLYERGRKGDPLVPCRFAQEANPNITFEGPRLKEAPLLPADLPEHQRAAINYFFEVSEDYLPCKVLQAMTQYDLTRELESPGPLFQVRLAKVPPAPVPPPDQGDNLQLRRFLASRQQLLEGHARVAADEEQQRRDLLRFLVQTGRLTRSDLVNMTYDLVMVTDTGWLPCRDDPWRTHWEPPDLDRVDDDDDDDDDKEEVDVHPQRYRCPLQVRAMCGDKTVPCSEAQNIVPVKEMVEMTRAHKEAVQVESKRRVELSADPGGGVAALVGRSG